MNTIYIYVLFDHKNNKPLYAAVKVGEQVKIMPMYISNTGISIYDIKQSHKYIHDLIEKAMASNVRIVTSNFKMVIEQFNIGIYKSNYPVYDVGLPIPNIKSASDAEKFTTAVVEKLASTTLAHWQNILANAAVVYQVFQNRGCICNYIPQKIEWNLETFTGRSKNFGFNLQGCTDQDIIVCPGFSESDVFVHFDWVSADIRIASILSEDDTLNEAFVDSDPYSKIMSVLNDGSDNDITREEAKFALLSAINSIDLDSIVLSQLYPKLGQWIKSVSDRIDAGDSVTTILGRRLNKEPNRNKLSYLNGVMQGSVAHAMQLAIRKIWEAYPNNLFAEIHDSIVCVVNNNKSDILRLIDDVGAIMTRPFINFENIDKYFPVNVSIGKKWKSWQLLKTLRNVRA